MTRQPRIDDQARMQSITLSLNDQDRKWLGQVLTDALTVLELIRTELDASDFESCRLERVSQLVKALHDSAPTRTQASNEKPG